MTETLEAQAIDVGPVRVDTGSNWLDFAFAVAFLLILAMIVKRWRGNLEA